MDDNYGFFKYITGDSKIHKMNSKMKIICFLLSIFLSVLINDYISLAVVSCYYLFIAFLTKINIKIYVKNILLLWPIYLLLYILAVILTFNGILALLIILKFILIILSFLILTCTTSLSEIAWGFECLLIKLKKIKVPVSKISLRIAFSIKFIYTLFEQYKNVKKSMAYRGVNIRKNRLFMMFKLFFPVTNLTINLSRRTISSMKLRFYGASKKRTNYHEYKATKFDKILIFINIVLIYAIVWIGFL